MGVLNPNSTAYVHPNEPNLLNIHKAMEYRDGVPHLRVNLGSDNITITGNVNIADHITVDNTLTNPVPVFLTQTATVFVTNFTSTVFVSNFTSTVRISSMPAITGTVTVSNFTSTVRISAMPAVTGTVSVNGLPAVSGTVAISSLPAVTGTVSIDSLPAITGTVIVSNFTSTVNINSMPAITGTVTVDNFTSTVVVSNTLTISNTSFAVTNFPTTSTVYQGTDPWTITGTVAISSLPEVEIKNDTGNPIPVSANTQTNSSGNPLYVSANLSNNTITVAQADIAVTAFDEPIAVPITPVIQADAMYGLDPDFWTTTKLNGGNIDITGYNTWQVSSGTSPGGYARLATTKYMTYQPGQGSSFRWTAAFTTGTASTSTAKHALGVDNIVQNTGPIDREDGYSFGYSGSSANDASRKIGILHRRNGKAEIRTLTITTPPTGVQTATITLNSVAYHIAITAGDIYHAANEISTALKANNTATNYWDIEGCNGLVTFTSYSPGAKSGTYSFSSTGAGTLAVGTFSQTVAGTTPEDTWTYVDQWDNQDIQFDPTKLNVYAVDLRWLGAGRVRFMMEDPNTGKMVLVHTQRWAGTQVYPHINKPALRIIYRSGTTNSAITPSKNVVVTGASVFAGIQGLINQTGASQGYYNIDSNSKAKDLTWHLLSIQNPFVRNGGVNKSSIIMQTLTVAAQGADPSVIFIVKNAFGASDVIAYQSIPNTTAAAFAQYSASSVSIDISTQRIANVQTLGINGNATFDLSNFNLALAPGETISAFISSSNALSRTAVGMTWFID